MTAGERGVIDDPVGRRRDPVRPAALRRLVCIELPGLRIEAAIDAGVSAYVVDGLKKERIKPILDTAIRRFRAFERLREELDQARSELSERKRIEKAKGILMRTRGLSEENAYALLRSTAMQKNKRIAEIAESLITAAGLLGEEEGP